MRNMAHAAKRTCLLRADFLLLRQRAAGGLVSPQNLPFKKNNRKPAFGARDAPSQTLGR